MKTGKLDDAPPFLCLSFVLKAEADRKMEGSVYIYRKQEDADST